MCLNGELNGKGNITILKLIIVEKHRNPKWFIQFVKYIFYINLKAFYPFMVIFNFVVKHSQALKFRLLITLYLENLTNYTIFLIPLAVYGA